ncbi:MAG: hypothetical protein OEY99_08625 [Aigarchaeota archaeon]|nr:hypothetical protein [Aigarchaeota archaeon]
MSKTRKLINKRTVLCLTLLLIALYVADVYLQYRSLYDDDLMLELIKSEERVEFEYIQLEEVKMSTGFWGLLGVSSPSSGRGSTLYIRYFTAWKYNPDEVSPEDNYKKYGWVDMRHRVKVSDSLEGNVGFV